MTNPFPVDENGRSIGFIKFFDKKNFYGFITNDKTNIDVGEKKPFDVFFHRSQFRQNIFLDPGQRVQFRLVETSRGLQARDCVVLDYIDPQDEVDH